MAIFLPTGIGEISGDPLVIDGQLHSTGQIFYVSSITGSGAFTGLNKDQPALTLGAAHTAAAAGDIIVLLDGHTETYAAPLTISKAVTIVGSGSSSGIPTVSFNRSADTLIFEVGAGVQLRNIKFPGSSVSATAHRVDITNASIVMDGCYFECSNNDNGSGGQLLLATTNARDFKLRNTRFVCTSTATTPIAGVAVLVSAAVSDLTLTGVVFDGGTRGFASGYAYRETAAPTRRRAESISMLRGADVQLSASAVQSYWQTTTSTGDARIAI